MSISETPISCWCFACACTHLLDFAPAHPQQWLAAQAQPAQSALSFLQVSGSIHENVLIPVPVHMAHGSFQHSQPNGDVSAKRVCAVVAGHLSAQFSICTKPYVPQEEVLIQICS